MQEYNFAEIENKWLKRWEEEKTYKVEDYSGKPKFYVLDMFPYPSGAGLHVGHPLGYIASDIFARYKKLNGFHVLHPMGFDAFGLPAEQYAIQTGRHPAETTEENIERYKKQLKKIGFSYDWEREIRTCDPGYYRWTQWIFLKLFDSWYDLNIQKARPIKELKEIFSKTGTENLNAACGEEMSFTSAEWNKFSNKKKEEILMNYRLAYYSEAYVNWCPALGTVLANDEVKDGLSERGGFPVERKLMPQWSLRITAYAERLLQGLEQLEWSESIKEAQRNWIGKSQGCEILFKIEKSGEKIKIFTTRPDTIYGVTYLVLAPEHPLVEKITSEEQKQAVEEYVKYAKNRSERDRQADVERVTGVFTGSYAIHPLTGEKIPIWIAEYVLYNYGTGAVMAVPAHDERDHRFALHFDLSIKQVVETPEGWNFRKAAYTEKKGKCINSEIIDGLEVSDAIERIVQVLENKGLGKKVTQYRLRDAVFGRQRYWGEPIPVYYDEEGVPSPVDENDLPVTLPEIDKYLPTETGEPPLARAKNWKYKGKFEFEKTTMPGWAGSSWYFIRYIDPHNQKRIADPEKLKYWQNVDLYIGGSEHATGHLIYARFWTKFLYDLGVVPYDEPFARMINQGMILGNSALVYRSKKKPNLYVSAEKVDNPADYSLIHVDVNLPDENDYIDVKEIASRPAMYGENLQFDTSIPGKLKCVRMVEKMSKSKLNVVNPDDIIEKYGADTLRCYEMFLGPITDHKPWDTKGIEGVHRFIKKFWRLFHMEGTWSVSEDLPDEKEWKVLHKTIKKVRDDIERASLNTVVSHLMIAVNELQELKCNKRKILEPLVVLISPYAPFIAEELWEKLGHSQSVYQATFPKYDEKYLQDSSFEYPVSFNGKVRFKLELPVDMSEEQIKEVVVSHENSAKWLQGKTPKKIIVVKNRIINVVV